MSQEGENAPARERDGESKRVPPVCLRPQSGGSALSGRNTNAQAKKKKRNEAAHASTGTAMPQPLPPRALTQSSGICSAARAAPGEAVKKQKKGGSPASRKAERERRGARRGYSSGASCGAVPSTAVQESTSILASHSSMAARSRRSGPPRPCFFALAAMSLKYS